VTVSRVGGHEIGLVLHPGVFVATLKSMNHDNCLTEQIVSNICVLCM